MSAPPRQITRTNPHRYCLSLKDMIELRESCVSRATLIPPQQIAVARTPPLPLGIGSFLQWRCNLRVTIIPTPQTSYIWQPALPSAERNELGVVSDLKHPVPKSIESDISPTEPPGLSQPPATGPLEKIETHPRATKSTLSFSVYRCFVVSSLICLFAFFFYILPSPLLELSPFYK